MIRKVFADTSFYVALIVPADRHHEHAISYASDSGLRTYTSEFVVCELANYFAQSGRQRFLEVASTMVQSGVARISPASHKLFEAGFDLYARRRDKGWSLTDCTSFVEMKRLGISEALTNDQHFKQAGFKVLMT